MPTYADPWIETRPDGGRAKSLGDDDIREFKRAVRQRLSTDHDIRQDESGITTIGYHKQCTFIESADLPAGATGLPLLGAQTHPVGGKPELAFVDEDNTTVFITKDGKMDAKYLGNLANIPDTSGNIPLANLGAISSSLVPSGLICMWSGLIANIPSGWYFCNGSNGTPDLRDMMIVGAKQDDAGAAKTNVTGSLTTTGGEAYHTLTVNEMPAHTHTVAVNTGGTPGTATPGAGTSTSYSSITSSSAGGGVQHNNMPPYYALAFIMKA